MYDVYIYIDVEGHNFLTDYLILPQKELKMEYSLWQLFNIERDVASTLAQLEVDRATLLELNHGQEKLEAGIKARKKIQAVFSKEALLLDKKIAKNKADLDKKVGYFGPSYACCLLRIVCNILCLCTALLALLCRCFSAWLF